jgi:hypothetical protein
MRDRTISRGGVKAAGFPASPARQSTAASTLTTSSGCRIRDLALALIADDAAGLT